jgi:hypothetical protein
VITSATAKIGITRYFENLLTWQAFIINAGDGSENVKLKDTFLLHSLKLLIKKFVKTFWKNVSFHPFIYGLFLIKEPGPVDLAF